MEDDECLSMIHDFQILKSLNTNSWQQMNELPRTASSSRAYFSISSLRDSCQSDRESKHFTFLHTYEQTRRQTRACTNTTQKVRGRALPDTHGPTAWEFDYGLDSTPSFALQLSLVAGACICVSLCAQPGQPVYGCFCSDDMSVCFGESLCLSCTLWEMTPLVTILFCFFNWLTAVSSSVLLV